MFVGNKNSLWAASKGTTLKEDLLSCLEFDETSGLIAYDSFSTNNFNNSNALINQAGILDKSYDFDGLTSYLSNGSLGNLISLTNVLTVSMWFNKNTSTGVRVLFEYSENYNSNGITIYFSGSSVYAGQKQGSYNYKYSLENATEGWTNVIATFDRNKVGSEQVSLYVNNISNNVDVQINTLSGNFGNENTYIGSRGAATLFYNGNIDQTSVWSRPLTLEERELIYNNGIGLPYTQW